MKYRTIQHYGTWLKNIIYDRIKSKCPLVRQSFTNAPAFVDSSWSFFCSVNVASLNRQAHFGIPLSWTHNNYATTVSGVFPGNRFFYKIDSVAIKEIWFHTVSKYLVFDFLFYKFSKNCTFQKCCDFLFHIFLIIDSKNLNILFLTFSYSWSLTKAFRFDCFENLSRVSFWPIFLL